MNQDLVDFTRQALANNIERKEIESILRQAGWRETDIAASLASFADVSFAIPVPKPKVYLSARDVFLNLIMFASLYVTVFNVADLLFDLINKAFPDALHPRHDFLFDSIRWNISSLIVTYPLFLFTFRKINAALAAEPVLRGSKPRKWLTYITLFIAAMFLVGDLIGLVYNALGGELTVRFILKVLTIAVLAGGNFLYFISDMRKEEKP